MFSILPVEIQYLCKVRYGLHIEPMSRNKPNIINLLLEELILLIFFTSLPT